MRYSLPIIGRPTTGLATFKAGLAVAIVLGLVAIGQAFVKHGHCARCGCDAPCRTVCRLVCEEETVELACFGVKREPLCVPCPGRKGCLHCETVCDECQSCNPNGPHTAAEKVYWFNWFPTGARMYSRTKLMRKTEHVTVPSYKWVVEELCAECASNTVTKRNEQQSPSLR